MLNRKEVGIGSTRQFLPRLKHLGFLARFFMRVVVTGGRDFDDKTLVREALSALPRDTVIINGGCRGADTLCAEVAKELGMHVRTFPANWSRYGKKAGPIRNAQMLKGADLLLAFPGGAGTGNCIAQARVKGIPIRYAK